MTMYDNTMTSLQAMTEPNKNAGAEFQQALVVAPEALTGGHPIGTVASKLDELRAKQQEAIQKMEEDSERDKKDKDEQEKKDDEGFQWNAWDGQFDKKKSDD
jgi:Skp family chaperone for outer membrane proteins